MPSLLRGAFPHTGARLVLFSRRGSLDGSNGGALDRRVPHPVGYHRQLDHNADRLPSLRPLLGLSPRAGSAQPTNSRRPARGTFVNTRAAEPPLPLWERVMHDSVVKLSW